MRVTRTTSYAASDTDVANGLADAALGSLCVSVKDGDTITIGRDIRVEAHRRSWQGLPKIMLRIVAPKSIPIHHFRSGSDDWRSR